MNFVLAELKVCIAFSTVSEVVRMLVPLGTNLACNLESQPDNALSCEKRQHVFEELWEFEQCLPEHQL